MVYVTYLKLLFNSVWSILTKMEINILLDICHQWKKAIIPQNDILGVRSVFKLEDVWPCLHIEL